MEIGIGLPNATHGVRGPELTAWAREAEQAGFSSLGTIDRAAYENYEPLVSLAAAAAATASGLPPDAPLLAPPPIQTAPVAQQAASAARAARGRLLLGP